jgi:hypothetical protein
MAEGPKNLHFPYVYAYSPHRFEISHQFSAAISLRLGQHQCCARHITRTSTAPTMPPVYRLQLDSSFTHAFLGPPLRGRWAKKRAKTRLRHRGLVYLSFTNISPPSIVCPRRHPKCVAPVCVVSTSAAVLTAKLAVPSAMFDTVGDSNLFTPSLHRTVAHHDHVV